MANSVTLRGITMLKQVGDFRPAVLDTDGGTLEAQWYEAKAPAPAVLWLGEGAGFDSPAGDLYGALASALLARGAGSLRLQYRNPGDRVQTVLDGLVGAFLLQRLEIPRFVAVGWGVGAAAAIEVARQFPTCAAVAVIAPVGVKPAAAKGLGKPMLILQGTADAVTTTAYARDLLEAADEPRRIVYYKDADHALSQAAADVRAELSSWLDRQLGVGEVAGA